MSKRLNEIIQEAIKDEGKVVKWPDRFQNSATGRFFEPQNEEIAKFIYDEHEPKYVFIQSGEGGGKTAHLSVKALVNLKKGLSGAIIAVDLPMMRRIFQEIRMWIPWDTVVIPEHRHMGNLSWEPYKAFTIVFYSEVGRLSKVIIGGLGDPSQYSKWESLNINWVFGDEFRSIPNKGGPAAIRILAGRIRLLGPNGERPQMFISSTPTSRSSWLYDYFGPEKEDDPLSAFKKQTKVIHLSLSENLHNLAGGEDHIETRGSMLTENERTIYIEGGWGEEEDDLSFIENVALWDRLEDKTLPPLRTKKDEDKDFSDMMVLGVDGSIRSDSFAIVGVTRHPDSRADFALRIVKEFIPKGGKIDFTEVRDWLTHIMSTYEVVALVYDEYQLYYLMEELKKEGLAWVKSFSQQKGRDLSDEFLYDCIMSSRLKHTNQEEIREHMKNAGVKYSADMRKKRLIKKADNLKIDLCVATSMALFECNRLNI